MDKIQSIESIRWMQASVREKRKGFITNFYLDEFKHSIYIQEDVLFSEIINGTVFFIKKLDSFWNVYYTTNNLEDLSKDLEEFVLRYNTQKLIFDIVGRDYQCDSISQLFKNKGFECVTSLVRMSRQTTPMECINDECVKKASYDDIKVVYDLLHNFFNEKTEQIPFLEELKEYCKQGHISVYKNGNDIVGFVIYEMNVTTQYLRYWFTHPDFREKKVGSFLLRKFFEEGKNTKRQLFWVIRNNKNAIQRYKHYGFTEENMYDYVMSNKQ